jgi:hypothetical protein
LVLAADAKAYVGGLTAFREERAAEWILLFAQAIERAASKASELALRLAELQHRWRERAGRPRRPTVGTAYRSRKSARTANRVTKPAYPDAASFVFQSRAISTAYSSFSTG